MENNLDDFKLSQKAKNKLKNKEKMQKELAQGKTAHEILEIPDGIMLKLYQAARYLFENRHYSDAADAFMFLISLNAHNHEYWVGLGMATQMGGNFEAAIDAYEMAAIYEVENPIPYFYLAKCLFAIHEKQSAIQALEIAIQYSGDSPEFQELREQAAKALELLQKQI